jgi:hypothetical protein
MSGGAALPRRTRSTASVEGAERASDDAALPRRARSTPSADGTGEASDGAAAGDSDAAEPAAGPLPRRIRQASLAPQLKQDTAPRAERGAQPADRDAEEVRSRMASLQRGWQRGRRENAAGDDAHDGTAQGKKKGDGR